MLAMTFEVFEEVVQSENQAMHAVHELVPCCLAMDSSSVENLSFPLPFVPRGKLVPSS